MTADQLIAQYGYWGAHPAYPVKDWLYEVRNGDTRQGYWDWVVARIEEEQACPP